MNKTHRFVALTASAMLAASVFLPAQLSSADSGIAGVASSTTTSSTSSSSSRASVSASAVTAKPVGQTTNVWGTARNVPAGTRIVTQVRLASGWSTSQVSTVQRNGSFVIELTYGKNQPGTRQWRIVAQPAGRAPVVSNTFSLTRTAVTAATAGEKRVGQSTNGWGTVSGIPAGAHIESQVKLANGQWSRSQVSKVASGGRYVIPLTYGANQAGTYQWRFVARHAGVVTSSPEVTLRRTAAVSSNATVRAQTAGTKAIGAATNTWGTTTGIEAGTRIETQVRIGNRWSRSQVSTVRSDGSFVLPLTYGANQVGTYRYRVVVQGDGFSVVSNEFVLTRVAPSTLHSAPSAAVSGFPDARKTGVPAGTQLRDSGSIVVTVPGTVIDGLNVNGSIDIQASNVTIRNTRVVTSSSRYPIRVGSGTTGTLIERVEVSNGGSDGKGIYFNGGSGTVRYSNIHSAEDGIFITADNVTLEYNYVHSLTRHAGAHPDAVQIRGGDNITLRGNNLQAYNPAYGVSNAAIQIGSLVGDTIDNLLVVDNLMNGGHVTVNGGGRGEVASAIYRNNKFGRDHQYAVSANMQNSVWENNTYQDNGAIAR